MPDTNTAIAANVFIETTPGFQVWIAFVPGKFLQIVNIIQVTSLGGITAFPAIGAYHAMGEWGDTTPQRLATAVLVRPEAIVALLRVQRATSRHDGE